MGMNFLVYALGMLGFWATGFALQMGGVGALSTLGGDTSLAREFTVVIAGKEFGLFGLEGFFLTPEVFTPAVAAMFLFQMMFMDTAATIPTGSAAERWKLSAFVVFSLAVGMVIYPVYANWVWGGGWLAQLGKNFGLGHGHVDFAGSSVVHLTGGVMALCVASRLGARIGKFGPRGEVRPIPAHSMVMVVTGTFILAFGWFGFNAGSTLGATDTRIAVIAVNTMLASAAGAVTAYLYTKVRFGLPDLSMMCNGMLAGMVAITAPCAFVTSPSAILIGAISGVLVVVSTLAVEQNMRIDDPVGAVSVHGVNGVWGILAVGLFADGRYGEGLNGVPGGVRGLFYGDSGQLIASCLGIVANVVWVTIVASVVLLLIEVTIGNRVSVQDEVDGLDLAELGAPGYSADTTAAPLRLVSSAPGASPVSPAHSVHDLHTRPLGT
jgi:Amt family ammonium transporter